MIRKRIWTWWGDTTLTSVQVEWIFLKTRMMKRYYFEKKRGMWMLEAINLREMEKGENEDFVEFYTRFVTDSVYQSKHISHPPTIHHHRP